MGQPGCFKNIGVGLLLIVCILLPSVFCQDDLFTAAVYRQIKVEDRIHSVQRNLDIYENVAAEAAARGVDIILYPELGVLPMSADRSFLRRFTETIPDPQETPNWIPCLENPPDNPIVTRLSCMARNNRIYIVANIADEQPCKPDETCRPDGVHIYNTNVAFDRNGTLVARYHKRFLFFEPAYDRSVKPNYVTFDTEFGRFGLIVCFDTMFNESVHLVENYHVDTIIAPVWWSDELPYISAIQMFEGWATTNHVNLLLANMHEPKNKAIGSGIFSWQLGALNYTHNTDNHPLLLIAKLPSKPTEYNNDIFWSNHPPIQEDHDFARTSATTKDDYRYDITDMSNYTIIPLSNQEDSIESCNNGLCCSLSYNSMNLTDKYYLAVHRGIRVAFNHYSWYQEVCTVFECELLENGKCKNISLDSGSMFNKFRLQGNFTTKYVYPSVLGPHVTLAPRENWIFTIRPYNNVADLRFKSGPPLLAANLFGRVYDKDPEYHV